MPTEKAYKVFLVSWKKPEKTHQWLFLFSRREMNKVIKRINSKTHFRIFLVIRKDWEQLFAGEDSAYCITSLFAYFYDCQQATLLVMLYSFAGSEYRGILAGRRRLLLKSHIFHKEGTKWGKKAIQGSGVK